ncbi:AraC family transcriptional regulator [Streptomyces sp. NPDC050636]|uniref:helix-turn-helix domain-containing protein n=1 Tax=Streptomyces sp. NPDC050636 TaxID=3154510 RepID=UPI0034216159
MTDGAARDSGAHQLRPCPPQATRITAWRPAVPGITEVFHARFAEHAYPTHTHDAWTVMIVDDGAVDFGLDRHRHGVTGTATVALLPPGVAHDGRTVTSAGFRKRVLYLAPELLPSGLIGPAVDVPLIDDRLLRHRIHQLHRALGDPGETLQAESRLAFLRERLRFHLAAFRSPTVKPSRGTAQLASALRDLLESRLQAGITLQEAAALLHTHPTHAIRAFRRTYGLPPHAYLTGRRIDEARRLLLAGRRPAEVAPTVGFYDQAHLHRHFTRHLGITPARFAASPRRDLPPGRVLPGTRGL